MPGGVDDVDWVIYGPIEISPFLGARLGKAAVLEVCRQIGKRVHRFDRESIMLARIFKHPRIVVRR